MNQQLPGTARVWQGVGNNSTVNQASIPEQDNKLEEALDQLHTLPLSIMPIKNSTLKRLLFVKNARLEPMVELFSGEGVGSGQIPLKDIRSHFGDDGSALERDIQMLGKLQSIGSFDVYTLRIALRSIDIGFERYDTLKLSDAKRQELTRYMATFTRPLLQRIYGPTHREVSDMAELVEMFTHPDKEQTLKQIRYVARELGIELAEVPLFLADYGDMFLSIAYYRNCFDQVKNDLRQFLPWAEEVCDTPAARATPSSYIRLRKMVDGLYKIAGGVTERFGDFEDTAAAFWHRVNGDAFREMQAKITGQHELVGTVLCGLVVKLDLWRRQFPGGGGGPTKRLEFIEAEMMPGLERIAEAERKLAA